MHEGMQAVWVKSVAGDATQAGMQVLGPGISRLPAHARTASMYQYANELMEWKAVVCVCLLPTACGVGLLSVELCRQRT